MYQETIPIGDYLTEKGIQFRESGGELITHCVFSGCDEDSRPKEAHLYFSSQTSQYHCKKCHTKGNIHTLAKFLGDPISSLYRDPVNVHKQKTIEKKVEFDPATVKTCHKMLPSNLREYLNQRGIDDDLISQYKIGFGIFYGQNWITIPVTDIEGHYQFLKLRRIPGDAKNSNKYKFFPTGSKAGLYGRESLKNNREMVVICEGEFDCLMLLKNKIPAITSTGGAGTFKKEWIDELKKVKKIYVCYDSDEMGEKGAENLIKTLSDNVSNAGIYKISLPEMGNGKDITDYLTKYGGNIDDLFDKFSKQVAGPKSERIIEIKEKYKQTSFQTWKKVIDENFTDLSFSAEIAISAITQLLITDITNPFALVLVDVPSSGKTITLNFFSGIEGLTYTSDKFTSSAFVSNAANVKKEKLAEIDLLPRLRYKTFIVRDLATIFSKREEDLTECLGVLTRVLDGEGLQTDTGTHGQRKYNGEYLFMLLAASTPIPPKVWRLMGNLGSRLFFLNMNAQEKDEKALVDQVTSAAHKEKEMICRNVTKNFLYSLWNQHSVGVEWDKEKDSLECKLAIARCAKLLARLRGAINLWKEKGDDDTEYSHTKAIIEKPDRINQLLYNLCRGHALVSGRKQINKNDLPFVIKITFDSALSVRGKLLQELIKNGGVMNTKQIEKALKCSKPTALKEMEILRILGICEMGSITSKNPGEPQKGIKLSEDLKWFLSDEFRECSGINKVNLPL